MVVKYKICHCGLKCFKDSVPLTIKKKQVSMARKCHNHRPLTNQGQFQDFLRRGSNLQREINLLILPDYSLFFPDLSENPA